MHLWWPGLGPGWPEGTAARPPGAARPRAIRWRSDGVPWRL